MARINKTRHCSGWEEPPHKLRELSRSFDTLEEARRFSNGKQVTDIYKKHGKFTVVWVKKIVVE